MSRKGQGWITFQSSTEELELLEEYCKRFQRTKTDVLRSLVRSLEPKLLKYQTKQFDSREVDLDIL
ncbi:CopG family transcriptional regulator [Nostoc sp. 2RC]|nr:CopG family transcriptional regulator [Nostoc sp. 2RC]